MLETNNKAVKKMSKNIDVEESFANAENPDDDYTDGKLKLYVWGEFCPDYTEGLAFAIAESLDEAKEMLKKDFGFESSYGPVTEHEIKKTAYGVYGGS